MSDEQARWARVKEILGMALETPADGRAAAVAEACGGDTALREEVESLLASAGETMRLDRCLAGAVESAIGGHPAPPARVGPYRIDRVLGAGGMGTVYLGVREDDQVPGRVAIKVAQFGGASLLDRFRHERRILAGLIHPYIARLLDAGMLDDGRPYFVMEYVDGRPIDQYVDEARPPVLPLFLKVCAAVQFAHQNLVVHRDLKAGNILVTGAGDPRLLDFGIAKLLAADGEARTEETRPWEAMLTPSSASPEQASGAIPGMASDVYSLGVLLYRLLAGVSPYWGAPNFAADPYRAIREHQPPLASTAPGLTPRTRRLLRGDLDNILRKALEKDPARRYSTAHEFAADIERHLKGLPVEARPAAFSYRASRFVRRNRLAVTAAALLALTVTAGLGASLRYAHRAELERARAEREFSALRKLTHSFLFEIDDAIQNLSGATAVHELVVRRSIEYLDQLATDAGSDPVVLNDLAEGYSRIANLIGSERHARPDMALKAGIDTGLKAVAIRRRLAALNPRDPQAIRNLHDSLWAVSGSYAGTGDYEHAIELQRERLQVAARIPPAFKTTEDTFSLGATWTAICEYQMRLGRYQEALDAARRSLAVRQTLLDSNPANPRARRVLAISHEFIGYVLFQQGDYRAAAAEHRTAAELAEAMVQAEPNRASGRRMLAVAQENLCDSMARAGSAREALPFCESAVAQYTKMADADRNDVQASEDLASGESTLSLALERTHALPQAMAWQQRARRLYDAALPQDRDSLDLQELNGWSLMELASIEQQLGDMPAARSVAARASAAMRELSARFPQCHMFVVLQGRAQALADSLR